MNTLHQWVFLYSQRLEKWQGLGIDINISRAHNYKHKLRRKDETSITNIKLGLCSHGDTGCYWFGLSRYSGGRLLLVTRRSVIRLRRSAGSSLCEAIVKIKIHQVKATHRLRVLGALELQVRRAIDKHNKEIRQYLKENGHTALGLYADMEAQNDRD